LSHSHFSILVFLCFFIWSPASGQEETIVADTGKVITVHIIHGSRRLYKYRHTEKPLLGGLRGGHVVNQVGDSIYGFQFTRWKLHIIPKRKKEKKIGMIQKEGAGDWKRNHAEARITSIVLPVTNAQYQEVLREYSFYKENVPYDYAFFGMRCAASCYEILAHAGVLKKRKHGKIIAKYFYPRPLRKYLQDLAKKNNYPVTTTEGSKTRKWEKNYR
jgi:hypothetical protein